MIDLFQRLITTTLLLTISCNVFAKTPVIKVFIKNHVFVPAEITIAAGEKVKLLVINQDPTPEEFESYELNREKVIAGSSKAIIFIGPLKPGVYPFFGEFNPKSAQGLINVK